MIDINAILKKMTIKAKIAQLNLISYNDKTLEMVKNGEAGAIINLYEYDQVQKVQEAALSSPMQIPLLIGDDVIHGFRTVFPVPLAEACSFNLELMKKTAYYSMMEAKGEGVNWIYAPMIDITNDPRWGRVMETSGEDPYLGSMIARARVEGIQTQDNGQITAACAKHFLGYGACEAGLDYNTTDYSEHKMRNLYLPPFKAAIDQGVMSIMHAFTTFNDLPITMNYHLLIEVLRNECQFDGALVTDWDCLKQLLNQQTVANEYDAAEIGIQVGVDIDMHSKIYFNNLEAVINNNPHLLALLDKSVERILLMKEKMGLFNNPYVDKFDYTLTEEILNHALKSACESIILFKNEKQILPLKKEAKIMVIGRYNDDQVLQLGAWSGKGKKEGVISIGQGLKETFPNSFFYDTDDNTDWNEVRALSVNYDYIVLALAEPREYSGENRCRINLNLPFDQDNYIDYLNDLKKPIITIVSAGRPLAITKLDKNSQAILWNFHLGHMAGRAIAKILSGDVNPNAKTVITFPKELGQVPIYYNRYPTGRDHIIHYVDGDTNPLYPFGYGLSYSTFLYHEFDFSIEKAIVTLKLENVSNIDGYEIVQVYALASATKFLNPKVELIGFKKVFIKANESIEVSIKCELNINKYLNDFQIMVGPASNNGIKKIIKIV